MIFYHFCDNSVLRLLFKLLVCRICMLILIEMDIMQSRKSAKKAGSKRGKKAAQCEGEDGSIAVTNRQSLSCCTSENDSIGSQESPVAAKSNGKAQSGHRSATDPQSLYARVLEMIFWIHCLKTLQIGNLANALRLLDAEKKREDQWEAQDSAEPCTKWNQSKILRKISSVFSTNCRSFFFFKKK